MSGVVEYKPGNGDDGWHLVSVTLRDGMLGIHYQRSPDNRSDTLDLTSLKSPVELYSKFRHPSTAIKHCRELVAERQVVTVACPPIADRACIPDGTRYFDARLEKVRNYIFRIIFFRLYIESFYVYFF